MQLPLWTPESTWQPPTTLPNLGKSFALDFETCDPNIKKHGPGWKRQNDGFPVGVAVANADLAIYLPWGHQGGDNMMKEPICRWLQRQIQSADEVLFANASYDLGWLKWLKLPWPKVSRDVQVAEALLDEERLSYSLDAIATSYGIEGKNESLLKEAARDYGVDAKAGMWKLPARFVGPYAAQDARATYDIYQKQKPLLQEQDLTKVWELECQVTPILTKMSLKGVPVNQDAAEKLSKELHDKEQRLRKNLGGMDEWSSASVGQYLQKLGIPTLTTEKGNISVPKEWIANHKDSRVHPINELRKLNRLRSVFIDSGIIEAPIGNAGPSIPRVHCCYRQTASDAGGTRSGRLSSSNPNLQQVPKRSSEGKTIRTLYIAEPGSLWGSFDYSSQEPRLQVHYALLGRRGVPLEGAKEAKQSCADGIKLYTFFEKATGLPYDTCKMLCLGISYGMGVDKMAQQLGVSEHECREILQKFNTKAPFLRMLFDDCNSRCSQRGWIKTILGRRSRFDFWSPGFYEDKNGRRVPYTPYKGIETARKHYPNEQLNRCFTTKGLNRLIQGSAADQTKAAMVELDRCGYDQRLQVHDEINIMLETPEDAPKIREIMETIIPLKVPVVCDVDLGKTWGG